ncbi:MAG: hypothetical protein J6B68_11900 [Lachnospiraceae bacterium]|nr:hypothetical protein [Lachnospiraceae bacterium]
MKYGNEGMDCKKLMLCFLQKIWVVVLAAVIGAVLGGGIYLFHNVVLNSNREYRAESKVYLDFAPDESGEIYQEYNGYTWNDLMSTELILDTTMSYLPDTYTEEEVVAATKAEILSDLRLLTITITTSDADKTAEILKATDLSLVDMGDREKEFIDIEVIKETKPELVAADERLLQAVLIGLVIALTVTILGMALIYVFNDKIYVPYDLKSVTDIPFAGYMFAPLKRGKVNGEKEENGLKAGDSKLEQFVESMQKDLEQNKEYLAKEDGVILEVPYAKMTRTKLAYDLEQHELLQKKIVGIVICDADVRFIKWYYNHL